VAAYTNMKLCPPTCDLAVEFLGYIQWLHE